MNNSNVMTFLFVIAASAFLFTSTASADMKQMKAYKEAYPDTKPKCIECHDSALPKKDDGQHENNEYGKAIVAEAKAEAAAAGITEEALPTVEAYKKVGKIEDFKVTK